MTTCELRLKAAEVIDKQGWCRFALVDGNERVCLLGALAVAAGTDLSGEPEEDQIVAADGTIKAAVLAMGLNPYDGEDTRETPDCWNDQPGRTADEVVARLRDGCTEAR